MITHDIHNIRFNKRKEGTPGFEPGTSRSAVECSTTELYPQLKVAVTVKIKILKAVAMYIHLSHIAQCLF